jgi:bifunctional ADP-heptose synthase (sugar kinase/adenylyltransferase)
VVSVTADEYVNKGPGRPVFGVEQRVAALRALRCVDEVGYSLQPTAASTIRAVKPAIFAKGKDYAAQGIIEEEWKACESVGATVVYIGEKLGSSREAFPATTVSVVDREKGEVTWRTGQWHDVPMPAHPQPPTPLSAFLDTVDCTPEQFREAVEGLSGLNVLVVGDGIVDEYVECDVMGLTSKASVLSVQAMKEPLVMRGGGWAVADHARAFTGAVAFECSTAVTKRRYVDRIVVGQPIVKRFSVNADAGEYGVTPHSVAKADVVLVADFGHGTMTDELRSLVQQEAKFLAVNCQTNSANYGFNLIDKRYSRADLFSLDRTELDLAMGQRNSIDGVGWLARKLGARYGFLTRGDIDTIGVGRLTAESHSLAANKAICPALESRAIDTIGAGDAFFAVAALAGARGYPLPLVLLMGQLAGAQAAGIVGNQHPISKQALIEAGMALLSR